MEVLCTKASEKKIFIIPIYKHLKVWFVRILFSINIIYQAFELVFSCVSRNFTTRKIIAILRPLNNNLHHCKIEVKWNCCFVIMNGAKTMWPCESSLSLITKSVQWQRINLNIISPNVARVNRLLVTGNDATQNRRIQFRQTFVFRLYLRFSDFQFNPLHIPCTTFIAIIWSLPDFPRCVVCSCAW